MARAGTVIIRLDANTAQLIKGIKKSQKQLSSLEKMARKAKDTFKNFATGLVGLYAVKQGIDLAKASMVSFVETASEFEQYANRMDAFTNSVAENKSELARASQFALQFNQDIAQTTQTLLTMKNYGLKDSTEQLKVYGNTAIGSGKSINQFAEAMADALTGENERLKEFGVKASKIGQQIGYAWTDSSGKSRNIIIDNNKEIIDSTLSAIFNEKYVGQMENYANSWKGLAQSMKNEWTQFKIEVADEGLLNYFKAMAQTLQETLASAFIDTAEAAAGFTQIVMDGIESMLGGIGFLYDTWNGIQLVYNILKMSFLELVVFIGDGLNSLGQGLENLSVGFQNSFKAIIDAIGNGAYEAVNFVLTRISDLINSVGDALGEYNPFGTMDLSIGKYTSSLQSATAQSVEWVNLDWSKSNLNTSIINGAAALENIGQGAKKADEFISQLNKNYKNISQTSTDVAKQKLDAKNTLNLLGAGYGGLTKETKKSAKATKAHTKATKAHAKALKETARQAKVYADGMKDAKEQLFNATHTDEEIRMKKLGERLNELGKYLSQSDLAKIYDSEIRKMKKSTDSLHDMLKNAFNIDSDSIFGKLFDDFEGLFDGFVNVLKSDKGINGALAEMNLGVQAAGMLQKSGDSTMAAIGYAIEAVGALFSNTLSEAEIKAAAGRSEFESKSLTTMIELAGNNPLLPLTRSMLMHLNSMDDKFGDIANAISSSSNGLDLDGSDYQSTASNGFLGFSSKHKELIGAGIGFGQQTVKGFLAGVDAVGYEAVKVTSSKFWGLVKSEKIKEIAKDLPQSLKDDISRAFGEGIKSVMEAVEIIGFDAGDIQGKIDAYVLDLGKLNFKDLSAEEQSQALSNAMSEQLDSAFSQAISSIASPENVAALESMAHAGENYTETLVRAAVNHEAVRIQLEMFGQTATNFVGSNVLVQAAGGLEQFKNAMSIFTQNFFTGEEQKEMMQLQLQMALQTHNIVLPASKAQFKALVLETQQKILTLKANIQSMKAELVAKGAGLKANLSLVKAGEQAKVALTKAGVSAQVDSNNFLIGSAQEAGKASVGFGKSIHSAIEAMVTGAGEAVVEGAQVAAEGGDVDWGAITSPAIAAMEAELASLEGLYGTLMSNMSTFASHYNDAGSAVNSIAPAVNSIAPAINSAGSAVSSAGSAAQSAAEKFTDLEKSLIAIAQLKATWGDDDVSGKKIILDATKRITGLNDLTYDNFLERFEVLTADGLGLDRETLQAWNDMSGALRALHDAEEQRLKIEKDAIKKDMAFYEGIIKNIRSAYTGSISYLNSEEKSRYLGNNAQAFKENNDSANYIKTLQEQLANEKKMSVTKEEYAVRFDKYIDELKDQKPKKTTDDVVESLQDIKDELASVKDELESLGYQQAVGGN